MPEGGYLCYLDSSPKLPSCLLANHVADRVKALTSPEQVLNVLLIRAKCSKLSPKVPLDGALQLILGNADASSMTDDSVSQSAHLKAIDTSKLLTKEVELKSYMDPGNLAEQAVGLNLKLMKWRQAPELNLDVLKETKCLLLGSGSLGCQVARNLLSWGYTKLTFVDNGRVSYSNPVRQCLFTFDDSRAEDNFKATTAARRIAEIYPKVEAQGITMNIPMPGHTVTEEKYEELFRDVDRLDNLVAEHDVIFLLLDSREARWLPTVLAQVHKKLCMTMALGFDTFVVMRHGVSPEEHK